MLDALHRLLPATARRAHGIPASTGNSAPGRTFLLPDLGEGLTEAEVLEWKVAVGDPVEHDQVVAEVETAKSVVTLPSPYAGTVTVLHCRAGEAVQVGAPLLTVGEVAEALGSGAVLTGYGTSTRPGRRPSSRSATTAGTACVADAPAEVERSATGIPLGPAADKFVRGHRDTPAVTIWADTEADSLLAARTTHGTGLMPLLARACLDALAAFPELNSRVDADRQELVRLPQMHLGFAAQTDHGLVVPVVRNADRLPLDELAAELQRLTALARRGTLPAEHLTGGTFTLNNYGGFEVDGATPILNHPQAAMIGVGRITDRPWVKDGRVEVRKVVNVSLTFDHRVCDGGTAAGFLRHVVDSLTSPGKLGSCS
ncbi:dihydrolipoamide acetyltransferase family protein [Streptomyces coacervatus]|uniref:dihydrolipoamide acetyltransferase family protein n=1 Tax=Streptomyces coacervatus TaxID=647381 RepID=UPI0030B841F9